MGLPARSEEKDQTTLPMTGANARNVIRDDKDKDSPTALTSTQSVPTTASSGDGSKSRTRKSSAGMGMGAGVGRMASAPAGEVEPEVMQGVKMPTAAPSRPVAAMRKTSSRKKMMRASSGHERLESEEE